MHYVYILKSDRDKGLYVGCTGDLQKRLLLHNAGEVQSTKSRVPLTLIHYEAFLSKNDAYARERFYKTGWGKQHIQKMLFHYFNN